jgi:prophage DNA circulation protein
MAALPAGIPTPALPAVATTPARQTEAAAQQTLTLLVRTGAAIEAARVSASIDYTSRNQAETVRAQVTAALDAATDAVAEVGWQATVAALSDLRAAVAADLTASAAPLPRLAQITPTAVASATILAWRLWGDDPTRVLAQAADLTQRNGVVHPGYVPVRALEVLSPVVTGDGA